MPDFWQFPTGSMGLGPINAIYQARFMRYLEHRGLAAKTDAPPGVGRRSATARWTSPNRSPALSLAARERLDNLIFVINCNLQRLDGPVRGNGQIIQELESLFAGAGWNVIKVLWGSRLGSAVRARPRPRAAARLRRDRRRRVPDARREGRRLQPRASSSTRIPELRALVAHMSDEDIDRAAARRPRLR